MNLGRWLAQGLCMFPDEPCREHQAVAWGFVVVGVANVAVIVWGVASALS